MPASNADTTPSTRAKNSSLSLASRKRVDKIYPSGRCLIENVPSYNMVEYAHCLPRATKAIILTRLERSWAMPYRSLNLDSRRNIMRLGAVKHGLFDKNAWILLPEDHIIQLYFNAKDNPAQFPTLDNESYRYRFVPHPAMQVSLIHRQHTVERPGEIIVAAYSDTYSFPFTHLGLIESHLHPKFVIARTGHALERHGLLSVDYFAAHPDLQVSMRKIIETYLAWTRNLGESTTGEEDVFDEQDEDEDDEDEDEESNTVATRPRRASQVKKAPRYQGPSARKRQHNEQTDGLWLDDETLREFDREMRPEQARQSKMVAVRHWLSRLQPDSGNVV